MYRSAKSISAPVTGFTSRFTVFWLLQLPNIATDSIHNSSPDMYQIYHVLNSTWYINGVTLKNKSVADETKFFKDLGTRIKGLREKAGYSQEDMISHGYSVRYWQKIEAGKPITLRTLLRICRVFSIPIHVVVRGLYSPGNAGR